MFVPEIDTFSVLPPSALRETTVTTPDVLLRNNVHVSGNALGRTLVFAHGFGCGQEVWRRVAPQFEADFRVVLFDHVGAGHSDLAAYDRVKYDSLHGYAEDILELLARLDLRDVVFVGHSVSAMMAVLASTHDPSRFGHLVLVGPSPRYIDTESYRGGFSQHDIDGLLDSLDADFLAWSRQLAPVITGNADRPEIGDELTALFCRTDPAIARQFARVTFLSDNRHDLAEVTVPTTIIQSSDDVIAPTVVGEFVHEQIPGSTLVTLRSTGHLPSLSDPDELAAAIRAALS